MYRRRAVSRIEWFKFSFPLIAGALIGGGATLLYALSLFYPFVDLLKELSTER